MHFMICPLFFDAKSWSTEQDQSEAVFTFDRWLLPRLLAKWFKSKPALFTAASFAHFQEALNFPCRLSNMEVPSKREWQSRVIATHSGPMIW